jgi:outer membrane protein TolC
MRTQTHMRLHGLWTFIILIISNISFAQDADLIDLDAVEKLTTKSALEIKENLDDQSKKLTLRAAIEEGLRRNAMEKSRQYKREKNELDFKDQSDNFWFPQLSLKVISNETLVDNFYTDINSNQGTSKTATGYAGIGFDDYNLFNWGKDYLEYQNNKATYKRNTQTFNEQRRLLRFNIIAQYFSVVKAKRILQIKKSQLRHTSFMYRLAKEKLTLRKIKYQQYLQSKAEFLRSHGEFQRANYEVTEEENNLALLLGDDLSTTYTPLDYLKFTPMTTKKSESYKFAISKSPQFLEAKKDLENANRSFQKMLKENMPLPRFDLKLGAFRHNFTQSGAFDYQGLDNGSKNVELVASINMTWKIFGSGGLFNSRDTERSYINKRIAEIGFTEAKRNTSTRVNTLYRKIRYLEKQTSANQAFVKNAQKTFDKTLDNFISSKTAFAEMKIVLDSLIMSEQNLEISKYDHMTTKLQLAHLMGVDDFPGESFENMVTK